MKKLLALSLIGTSLFIGSNPAKADINYVTNYNLETNNYELFKSTSFGSSQKLELLTTLSRSTGDMSGGWFDASQEKFYFAEYDDSKGYNAPTGKTRIYDLNSDTWSLVILENDSNDSDPHFSSLTFSSSVIKENSDGSIQIGSDANDIDITAEGLNVNGNPLITKKDNGEIHIGKNSLITKSEEETLSDGRKVQPLYAKDAEGNKIPINIDGSKLLIDGVEVQAGDSTQVTTNKNNISTNTSNIKNLGEGVAGSTALTAALTALPQTSKESKLSCGVGTGAYSSRYAVGFGCASKVNERVDINAGGSYVFGGSKSYGDGTLDNGVIKAGFVFKLGELSKPTQISMMNTKKMETKIESLEEKNKQLLARLERLEKIALGESKSKDLAIYKLK